LKANHPGTHYFYLTVNTPSVLYGQEVTVEELTVYYMCGNSDSYISSTSLTKLEGASDDSYNTLIYNSDYYNSTAEDDYSIAPRSTSDYILDASSGPLTVLLGLHFDNTSDNIYIGAVRLRLGHTDPP
jgi:hypothetical protein